MENYHTPVLLEQSINGLNIAQDGTYVDCTYGGGGHSQAILNRLSNKGKLIAFDQDADAIHNQIKDSRLLLIRGNFRFMQNYLQYEGIEKVDGILADLGVSSHHFDTQDRGFSFRFDADLDMRMNKQAKLTAKSIINEYDADKLKSIFRTYGEIKNTNKLVYLIEQHRQKNEIKTIEDFKQAIEKAIPQKLQAKYLAKVFQALRIEVNQEMNALKEMLLQTKDVLNTNGRLSIITYHSLEDRLVKNFIRNGMFEGEPEKDLYGNTQTPFTPINKKVIVPTEQEIEQNNRARSAKLRVAEKR